MTIYAIFDELLKQLDLVVTNYEFTYKELKEIQGKYGLEHKREELYEKLHDYAQQLAIVEPLVAKHYPYLTSLITIVNKLNKERNDKFINYINQKLEQNQEF
jgi:uncharacterized alpha-E superfamily protein